MRPLREVRSYAERRNLTMRMHIRRFTQPTNAFSKKVENHAHAITLRVTFAMCAGVADQLSEIGDTVSLEAAESKGAPARPIQEDERLVHASSTWPLAVVDCGVCRMGCIRRVG